MQLPELKETEFVRDRLTVKVKELDAAAMIDIQSKFAALDGMANDTQEAARLYFDLIAACVVNDEGDRPLTAEDVSKWPWPVVLDLGTFLLDFLDLTEKKSSS